MCFSRQKRLIFSVHRVSSGQTKSWAFTEKSDKTGRAQGFVLAEKDGRRAVCHSIAGMKMRSDEVSVGVIFILAIITVDALVGCYGASQSSTIDCFEGTSAPFASNVLCRHFLEGNRGGEESDLIGVTSCFPRNFSDGTGDAWPELSVFFANTIASSATGELEARFAHDIIDDLACCLGDGEVVSRSALTVGNRSAIVGKLITKRTDGRRVSVVAVFFWIRIQTVGAAAGDEKSR